MEVEEQNEEAEEYYWPIGQLYRGMFGKNPEPGAAPGTRDLVNLAMR